MTSIAITATRVSCVTCGGQFQIARLEREVVCPSCQTRQALPESLLAEHAKFRQAFEPVRSAADAATEQARAWQRYSTGPGQNLGLLRFLPFGLFGFAGLAVLLENAGVGGGKLVSHGVPVAVALGALAFFAQQRRHPVYVQSNVPAACAALGTQQMSCPACGATTDYDPRDASAVCAHCRTALFAPEPILRSSLDAARRVRREALLEKHRAERLGTAKQALEARPFAAPHSLGKVVAGVSGFIALALIGMTHALATGELDNPALYALWLALPIGWIACAAYVAQQRSRRARLESTLQRLAQQLGGHSATDIDEYVEWLNRHWAGAHPIERLGEVFHFVQGRVGSYPVLVEVRMYPHEHETRELKILLAAWVPGVSDREPEPAPPSAVPTRVYPELYQLGWGLTLTPAGLVATMDSDPSRYDGIQRRPESLSMLADVLSHMAAVARTLQAA